MQSIKKSYQSNQANNHFNRKEKIYGQFFTPAEVSDFIVSSAANQISTSKTGCDPACGDGVFLSSLRKNGFKPFGVDIDEKVIRSLPESIRKYATIENGLLLNGNKKFDMVVGNPPFSSKYGRIEGDILKEFDLGREFVSQAIEILFLEKFIKLCKGEGVIGIILPQGIFSDLRLDYVRNYIKQNLAIIAVISLPRNIFRSTGNKTSSKTCILIAKKAATKRKKIMFAAVNKVNELSLKNIRNKVFAFSNEFLYPEFYLEKNELLDGLPKLQDFNVEIIQGSAKYGKERKFSSIGIPFISAKTVTSLGVDFSRDERYIEPNGIMDNKKAHVEVGDVVFVRVGVGCIGRTAVITKQSEKGIADDWIYIIRVKDKRLSPAYLVFWLLTATIQKEIRRLGRGVGTMTIPIALVKELPVPIPNSDILRKCVKKYREMITERENGHYDRARFMVEETCKYLEILLLGKKDYESKN
jgi:type I restriction enzyme M protein